MDDVEYNRKELPLNRVKFSSTEGKYQKGYRQLQSEVQLCQRYILIVWQKNSKQVYLDRYEGVQAQIHQVSQFGDSSAVSTTYVGKTDKTREKCYKGSRANFKYGSLHNSSYFTTWYRVQNTSR